MENQIKLFYIKKLDLHDTIAYLKDYSTLVGKSYNQATSIEMKQQLAIVNLNLNKLIKKFEKEL